MRTLRNIFRRRMRAFLIVTHNPEVAAACDCTVVRGDGVAADDGEGGAS